MRTGILGTAALGLSIVAFAGCIPDDPAPAAKVAPGSAAASGPAAKQGVLPPTGATDAKSLLATVDALQGQLKNRPRDFGVNVALGNLFYDNGRYVEAIEYDADALKIGADAQARILAFAKEKLPAAKVVPEECRVDRPAAADVAQGDKTRPFEAIAQAAAAQTPADGPAAVACWRQLTPMLAELHAREGNAWYLVGDGDKAREDHVQALALDPDQPEALFFEGAHLLETSHGDPKLIAEGRAVWEHLLKVAPNHPRAQIVRETLPRIDQLFGPKAQVALANPPAGAGGLPEGHPPAGGDGGAMAAAPALAPGTMAAMQQVPRTPALEKQLDDTLAQGEELLQQKKWQAALETFKQVMPLRPDGRVALGMGIALRELGKPTAERVLTMAAQMPGGDPARARLELGMFYEKSSPAQAKALFQEVEGDPKVGARAKAELAKL